MKKFFALLTCLSLLSPVSALAQDQEKIQELQDEITLIENQLRETRQELHQVLNETDGLYVLESNSSTYIFSNPRVEDNRLLLDVDVRNDTKGNLDLNNEIWALQFIQEDETTIRNLWINFEKIPFVTDRAQINQNIRIKSGATLPLTLSLSYESEEIYYNDFQEAEGQENETEDQVPAQEISYPEFNTSYPLHVKIDSYLSPTGMAEEIIIDLE